MEEKIINKLISNNETLSTMESCTGGYLVSCLTNVSDSSKVIKVSLVTYSNEYKIKFGINKETIEKYSVYSFEVSREMAKNVCDFASSTYGLGITGQINKKDENNPYGNDNEIFVSIYNSKTNEYFDFKVVCPSKERSECKEYIKEKVFDKLFELL